MYLRHYNLNSNPFNISPDPRFLWFSSAHRKAYSILKYGILEDKGFLVLTGEIGTGKTLLINKLLSDCPVPSIIVTIPDPALRPLEFFHYLAKEAGMEMKFTGKGEFWVLFKQFLLQAYEFEKKVILIVDEAQRLSFNLLEQIRLMSNILKPNKKLINIFFVGQNEFIKLLEDKRSIATRQRVTTKCQLEPFTEEETVQYINHRLNVVGAKTGIFSPEALELIYALSKGLPRTINVICDNALRGGVSSGATVINADIIKSSVKLLPVVDKRPCKKYRQPIANLPEARKPSGLPLQIPLSEHVNHKLSQSPSRYGKKRIQIVGFLFLCLFGSTAYFIYNSHYSQPVRWSYEHILPKEKFFASKNEIQEIVPSSEILKKSKDNELFSKSLKNNEIVHHIGNRSGLKKESTSLEQDSSKKQIAQILAGGEMDKKYDEFSKKENFASEIPKRIDVKSDRSSRAATSVTSLKNKTGKFELNQPDNYENESSETQSTMPLPEEKMVIYFKINSNELTKQAYNQLDQIFIFISKYPDSEIIIKGYTDSSGNTAYNKKLSEFRADIVKFYFIVKGFDPSMITAVGIGAQNFIAANDTEEGRRLNRRVEIEVNANRN